jgi:integrase
VDGKPLLHIRGRKTARSDRFVPIPKDLFELIRKTPLSAYISPTDGNNKQGNNSKRAWEHFRYHLDLYMGAPTYRNAVIESKTIGLTPYCLRHEYCTELARKGIDIRTAQKLMGHSSINLTANIYTNLETRDIMIDELF